MLLNTTGKVKHPGDPIEDVTKTTLGQIVRDPTRLVEKNGVHTEFLSDIAIDEGGQSIVHQDVISWAQQASISR